MSISFFEAYSTGRPVIYVAAKDDLDNTHEIKMQWENALLIYDSWISKKKLAELKELAKKYNCEMKELTLYG